MTARPPRPAWRGAFDLPVATDPDRGPLRRHGERVAAGALGWRGALLTSFEVDLAHAEVRHFGRRAVAHVKALFDNPAVSRCQPHFAADRVAVSGLFGIGKPGHCFSVKPHEWLALTETQVTRGLAYFLQHPDPTLRRTRVAAFLRATGAARCAAEPFSEASAECEVTCAVATPGPATRPRRIDLLVSAEAPDSSHGCVIEAKLGHVLTPGQLDAYYRDVVLAFGGEARRWPFLVVGPRRTRDLVRMIAQAEGGWRFVGWRALLLRLERQLDPNDDDESFRRFRRTVWSRAGDF